MLLGTKAVFILTHDSSFLSDPVMHVFQSLIIIFLEKIITIDFPIRAIRMLFVS